MIKVEFDYIKFERFMKELGFDSDIIRKANKKIAFLIEQDIKRNIFSDQVDSKGVPWPKLKRKRKAGSRFANDELLRDTGRLFNSIAADFSKREVTVGTDVRARNGYNYAEAHQFGTDKIPKREFLFLRDGLVDDIFDIIFNEYDDALAKLKG